MSAGETDEGIGAPVDGGLAATASQPKPRRPRGPSKRMRAMIEAANMEGYRQGAADATAARRHDVPGLLMWMAVCFVAGFAVSGWLF